jgi:hypothetical protein
MQVDLVEYRYTKRHVGSRNMRSTSDPSNRKRSRREGAGERGRGSRRLTSGHRYARDIVDLTDCQG